MLTWHNGRLATIDISSADAKASGVEAAYFAIVAAFTADYGSPAQKVSYTLKIFPPVLVERTSWVIKPDKADAFTAIAGQQRQLAVPDPAALDAPGKLAVRFQRLPDGGAAADQ